jgi:hypothetical protein
MADLNNNNHNLIAAIKHSSMSNGEVVIKLNDQYITGHITGIQMQMQEGHFTKFEIQGIIR